MNNEKYILAGGKVVTPHRVIDGGAIFVENSRIKSILEQIPNAGNGDWEIVDCAGKIIMPAFIDVHTHGGIGLDFNDDKPGTFEKLSQYYYSHGVTTVLATHSPLSYPLLIPAVTRVAEFCSQHLGDTNIFGIHLEGPYINRAMRGGNRDDYIELPDFERWRAVLKAGRGFIRLMTVAPELPGIMPIIDDAVRNGIRISVGHSSADGVTMALAIEKGATQVTHLFNSMPGLYHRESDILAESLLNDKIDAQLIADGIHVHPKIAQLAIKLKGTEHIILITDSIRATQVGDGEYYSAGLKVFVRNGNVYLEDGTLAGSTLVMERALKMNTATAGIDLPSASRMTSLNAARSLGIDKETGSLESGKWADIVVLDNELNVEMTIRRGKFKYRKSVEA